MYPRRRLSKHILFFLFFFLKIFIRPFSASLDGTVERGRKREGEREREGKTGDKRREAGFEQLGVRIALSRRPLRTLLNRTEETRNKTLK